MLKVTNKLILPTTMVGSYPRPLWFTESLGTGSFKQAMGDSLFREQYVDAVTCVLNAQESAGLDILTDGDSRFDLTVGGKSWFFYVLERLGGIGGHRDYSAAWTSFGFRPGHILWEVMEAYQPPVVTGPVVRGPLEYAALWKVAQRLTDKPVKFGTISAPVLPHMMWNEFYPTDKALVADLALILNAELKELAEAGCQIIQLEEPTHHFSSLDPSVSDKDLEEMTVLFNKQVTGVDAEIWVHTCWGNPNQQCCFWEPPSYERALEHLLQLDADVITFECSSTQGKDLPLFAKYKSDKKIAIGVVSHTHTTVEPPDRVAGLIRKALEYIPAERLVITTDCGFGREGLSRRIAYYKLVSLVTGTNMVRRELGLPEARIRISDPRLWFVADSQARGAEAL
jgi:5-methyltetrahydropteroyltriglutamate--homocysteine methyltransferase